MIQRPEHPLVAFLSKAGPWQPWVVLAFALVYYLLFWPDLLTKADLAVVKEKVDANALAIHELNTTMTDAAKTMHDASARRDEYEKVVIQLLFAQCLQGVERGSKGEKDCLLALQGQLH